MKEQIKIAFESWYDNDIDEPLPTDYTIMGKRYLYMGWKAATAEANKRINALESEVAELKAELKSEKEHSNILLKNGGEFYRNELALKAHINTLREALKLTLGVITGETLSKSFLTKALEKSKMALNATPAESLQAHDDLRKLCEKIYADLKHGTVSRDTMELLREALKEVK